MRILGSAHITASDDVRMYDRPDLDSTVLRTGGVHEGDHLHIGGAPEERADFLRRLAAAAEEQAQALDALIAEPCS